MTKNILNSGKYIFKVYDKLCEGVSAKYNITNFELRILFFLKGNPECDTARAIAKILNLSKSNLSEAIDSLTKKGYLKGEQDENDRRYVRLTVRPSADVIINELFKVQDDFINIVTKDISKDKLDLVEEVIEQIVSNIVEASKNM